MVENFNELKTENHELKRDLETFRITNETMFVENKELKSNNERYWNMAGKQIEDLKKLLKSEKVEVEKQNEIKNNILIENELTKKERNSVK